ncbi:MAG: ABC transporter substrate-binding protein [Mycobacterium sp.]
MRDQWSRRGFLSASGAAGVLMAVGCSSRKSAGGSIAGEAVTITHAFGETTIPAPPKRVVSAGYTGQDDLLAVGVVPIAVTNWFGDQPFAVWPWAQPKLGGAHPVVLNLDNGIQVNRIAELKPDLIVATNAGVDVDTYQKLTAIAPTIPQSDGDAFFEPWKDQATAIGRAVFQADQMQSLIDGVDTKFTDVATAHPSFKDKKALLLQGRLDHGNVVASTGWRTEFLTQMGLVVADQAGVIGHDQIKPVLGATDVLIWTTESDDEQQALLGDPDIAAVQPRSVFTTAELAGAIAFASPLSYPLMADQLPGLIAGVVG